MIPALVLAACAVAQPVQPAVMPYSVNGDDVVVRVDAAWLVREADGARITATLGANFGNNIFSRTEDASAIVFADLRPGDYLLSYRDGAGDRDADDVGITILGPDRNERVRDAVFSIMDARQTLLDEDASLGEQAMWIAEWVAANTGPEVGDGGTE